MSSKLTKWFHVAVMLLVFGFISVPVFALSQGTATVDGDPTEWSAGDYYANMYRAGNTSKQVESKLYLRYDCPTSTLYALVITEPGVTALEQTSDAYLKYKVDPTANNSVKGVGGESADFEWVYNDNNQLMGWEGSFQIAPGEYTINAHVQVWDDSASQTSSTSAGTSNNRFIPLSIQCDDHEENNENNNEPPVIPTYSIAGTVYTDNAPTNQTLDAGEVGLAGVTVSLIDLQGNVIATTVTDTDGNYLFENLLDGNYIVQVGDEFATPTDDYIISGLASSAVILNGADSTDNNFGYIPVYDISGVAFIDANRNGVLDQDEPLLANTTIVLYDGNGAILLSATTDEDGHYIFEKQVNGDYSVVVPEATAFFPNDINEVLDSFFAPTTSLTIAIVNLSADSSGNNVGFAPDLTTIQYVGTGKTIGYWKHQHTVAIKGKGKPQVDAATLQTYLDRIEELFLSDPFQFNDANEFQSALSVLDSTSSVAVDLLKKQLLATELNEMDGRGLDNALLQTLLIQWGETIVAHSNEYDRATLLAAKDVFDTINNTGE